MRRAYHAAPDSAAFTLIEVLIVVVILGILATTAIVCLRGASLESREAVLREELQFMRTQIVLYRAAHASPPGISPQSGLPDSTLLENQLTQFTDYQGNTATAMSSVFSFPPYLSHMPANPFLSDHATQVTIIPAGADPASSVTEQTGWLYSPDTLDFYANSAIYGPGGKKW